MLFPECGRRPNEMRNLLAQLRKVTEATDSLRP
ncbi:hypothetical protein BJY20_002092 [Janibacter cremeus]|uniref:Uncharacterized protein n=1 Tax=Janibacter cremeus TaxID=1285192 RepID=A0A852VTG4_9MICO|nr:hypothetical protein [Janibacter cremeus]